MRTTGVFAVVVLAALGVAGAESAVRPYETHFDAKTRGQIDELVFRRLLQLGIPAAGLCSDEVFVRRVYLDVIGTLPTMEETRTFLQDTSADKRRVLIDRLLEREEFADYWAMKWSDLLRIKAEFPINLWPNAAQAYHHWVRTAIRDNMPYDRFVRELLTSNGSNFRVPQVNFYRAVQSREPAAIAQTVALTFMGTRAEKWPAERLAGMGAFFSQVGYKTTSEWKEEIIFFDPTHSAPPTTEEKPKPAAEKPPAAVLPDGKPATLASEQDPRVAFADWLITPENPWFTRNIANRVWSWLMGRGIIHEPDDLREDNPPTNPDLLALLEKQLIAARYDLKQLYRLILNSRTYQLSSIPRSRKPEAEANFAYYPLRRLEAEVLIDALNQITGTTEKYTSAIPEPFTFVPENQRSIALPDGSIGSSFLELFGRPPRDTGWESERNNRPSAAQSLHLLNSSHIQQKLEQSPKLQGLLQSGNKPRDSADRLYLTILARYPTASELKAIAAYSQTRSAKGREVAMDIAWALINSAEFLHRH